MNLLKTIFQRLRSINHQPSSIDSFPLRSINPQPSTINQVAKSFATSWLSGREDTLVGHSLLTSAYQQSSWVYACVTTLAESVSAIPFRFVDSKGNPLDPSPINNQLSTGSILLPEELIHIKLPNPFNLFRGLSPLTISWLSAQTDYAAAQFMKGLMFNNADTGLIVTTDAQLSPEQREVIEAALRNRNRSAGTP